MAKDTKAKKTAQPRGEKTQRGGCNFEIPEALYKKELELLKKGVDLLDESRRHG